MAEVFISLSSFIYCYCKEMQCARTWLWLIAVTVKRCPLWELAFVPQHNAIVSDLPQMSFTSSIHFVLGCPSALDFLLSDVIDSCTWLAWLCSGWMSTLVHSLSTLCLSVYMDYVYVCLDYVFLLCLNCLFMSGLVSDLIKNKFKQSRVPE